MWAVQREILSLVGLAIAFGPTLWLVLKWEREDRQLAQDWVSRYPGEPLPADPGESRKRWAIGIAVFIASGFVAALIIPFDR